MALEYQKIYQIENTATEIENDDYIELGNPSGTNNGDSKKISGENAKNSIFAYIDELTLKNPVEATDKVLIRTASGLNRRSTLSVIRAFFAGSILKIDGASQSSYNINSEDAYDAYYFDVQENQRFAINLDAPATLPGKIIEITYDSSNYGTLPITSTGANIRCKSVAYTTICLFADGETVKLRSDGTYWNVINNWGWYLKSGKINRSNYASSIYEIGTIGIVVSDSTGFNKFDIVDETISGYRGIVIYNDIGNDTVYILFTDDGSGGIGGYFTNGRTLSVISGGTVSSVITSNTKNVDTATIHGLNVQFFKIDIGGMMSIDGTETDAFDMFKSFCAESASANVGPTLTGIDNNSFDIKPASNGIGRYNLINLSLADPSRVIGNSIDIFYENDFRLK